MDSTVAIAHNEQLLNMTVVCDCNGEPSWCSWAPDVPDRIAYTCRHCGLKLHVTREAFEELLSRR